MNRILNAWVRALADRHTYDFRRNALLWFGVATGVALPLYGVLLALFPGAAWTWIAAVQPLLWSVVFGAVGTVLYRREAESVETWKDRALTDELTGVPNRSAGAVALPALLRSRRPFVVAMLDLADFKSVNDTFGHLRGDEVLREAAQTIRASIRSSDLLCRYGGDEFLLLVPAGPDVAMAVLIRAMEALKSRTGLGVSVGMSSYPLDGDEAESLLRLADLRLVESKRHRAPLEVGS